MKKIGLSVVLLLIPALAFAADWVCRNNDMEITCSSGKCVTSDGFTPLSVNINDRGAMNVCAYSGCWEGKGKVLNSGNHLLVSGQNLKWSGTTGGTGAFMVALDRNNGIAVINGERFAMPLVCNSGKKAAK